MTEALFKTEPLAEHHYADLVGVRFQSGGRTTDGLDCGGLALLLMERRGFVVPEVPGDYEATESHARDVLAACLSVLTEPVDPGQEQPGDLAAYALEGDAVDHVAPLLPDGKMLHAWLRGEQVVALPRSRFRNRIVGWYRPVDTLADVAGQAQDFAESGLEGRYALRLILNPFEPHIADTTYYEPDGRALAEVVHFDFVANVNGANVGPDYIPRDGDFVAITSVPSAVAGVGAFLIPVKSAVAAAIINAVVAAALSAALSALTSALFAPPTPDTDSSPVDNKPTFNLNGIQNTIAAGGTVPVVFGTHRVGGQIIGIYNDVAPLTASVYVDDSFGPDSFVAPWQGQIVTTGPGGSVTTQGFTQNVIDGGTTTLNMLIAVSEGEIQNLNGFAGEFDSVTAPADLLIDGNEATSYRDIQVSTRLGDLNQAVVPGFGDVTNAVAFDVALVQSYVWTHVTTQPVDAFEIQQFLPGGQFVIASSSGTANSKTTAFRFRFRRVGAGVWQEDITVTYRYVHRGSHARKIRRDNLLRDYYEISLERLTFDDDDSSQTSNDTHVSLTNLTTVNEITYQAINYGGVALLGVQALASDQLSGVPTVTSRVIGKKLWVWDGVDPDNPSFEFKWTDNPGEIVPAIMLNKVWGLGNELSADDLDWESWGALADYCDEVIDDGQGGTMARWRFDYVIDTQQKAGDVIQQALAACRSQLKPVGSRIGVTIDQASTPVQLFSEGNVRDLRISYLDTSARPTRVGVQFANADLDYDIDIAPIEDVTAADADFVEETVALFGITKPSRAYRAAQHRLNVAQIVSKTVEFTTDWAACALEPGDTFWLGHQDLSSNNTTGRVVSATASSVTIDRESGTFPTGAGYKIRVQSAASAGGGITVQERTVSTILGSDLNVSVNLFPVPVKGDVYTFGPTEDFITAFRCTSVTTNADFSRTVQGIQYDATIYDDDPGTVPTSTDLMYDPRKFPTAVTNVTVTEEPSVGSSGDVLPTIRVAWTAERAHEGADFWYRYPDEGEFGWIYGGSSNRGEGHLTGIEVGRTIEVSVNARSPMGHRRGAWAGTKAIHFVKGRTVAPATATGFALMSFGRDLVAVWDEATDLDIGGYEIRVGTNWLGALVVGRFCQKTGPVTLPALTPAGSHTYHLKPFSTSGVYAHESTSITYTREPNQWETHSASEGPTFPGTATNMTVVGSSLEGDSGQTSLSYTTSTFDTSNAEYVQPTIVADITFEDRTALTWENAHFAWDSAGARARTWGSNELTDYPDSYEDAVTSQFGASTYPWDGAIAAGRTWSGLNEATFFKITLLSKSGSSLAAHNAADYALHVPHAVTLRYYSFKIEIEIPHEDYLCKINGVDVATYSPAQKTLIADKSLIETANGLALRKQAATGTRGGIGVDATDGVYAELATSSVAGAMSAADKTRFDALPDGNFSASIDPGTSSDENAGYAVGSLWVNTTSDEAFICCDSTASAAVWKQITGTASGGPTDDYKVGGEDGYDSGRFMVTIGG